MTLLGHRSTRVHGVVTPFGNLLVNFLKNIVDLQADTLDLFVPKKKSLLG